LIAAIPGTALLANNVLKFEVKANWYYKRARLTRHLLYSLKYEGWQSDQVSKELRKIEEDMELEWPGFGAIFPKKDDRTEGTSRANRQI
jgi:hypothetical protein